MASISRLGEDTILPERVLDDIGVESLRVVLSSKGALSHEVAPRTAMLQVGRLKSF